MDAETVQEIVCHCREKRNTINSDLIPSTVSEPVSIPTLSQIAGKGHVLLSSIELQMGDVCLVDQPLIEFPNVTVKDDLSWLCHNKDFDDDDLALLGYAFMQYSVDQINMLVAGMIFVRQPQDVQDQILSIFCPPLDYKGIQDVVETATMFHERFEEILTIPRETYLRMLCIKKVNGFGHKARRAVILYGTGCRLSHSCKPNCFRSVLPDGSLLVRAVNSIHKGEELTISYLQPEKMYSSASERMQYLDEGYLFNCDCPRCTADIDDTRGFQCEHCEEGILFAPLMSSIIPICSICNRECLSERWNNMKEREARLHQETLRLQKASSYIPDISALSELIKQCISARMKRHHTLYLAYELLYFSVQALADFPQAAMAVANQIGYLQAVSNGYPLPLAWKYEALADSLAGCVSLELHPDWQSIRSMRENLMTRAVALNRSVTSSNDNIPSVSHSNDNDYSTIFSSMTMHDIKCIYYVSRDMLCNSYGPDHHFTQEVMKKLYNLEINVNM